MVEEVAAEEETVVVEEETEGEEVSGILRLQIVTFRAPSRKWELSWDFLQKQT